MSLIKRNRSRRRRNFDEDSKVLIVTLLFCLVFSVIGLQKTLAYYQIIVLGLVQLLMLMAIGVIRVPSTVTLSPGITISTPSGNVTMPVTSVVRK